MSDERLVHSERQFAHYANDLLDSEIVAVSRLVMAVSKRFRGRPNTPENLDMLRDEIVTKLAEMNILATVDPSPCLYGEPPVVEIIGKLAFDSIHKDGFDHEQKGWEVNKAHARSEDYLGEREKVNGKTVDTE